MLNDMISQISSQVIGYLDSNKEFDESANDGSLPISLRKSSRDLRKTQDPGVGSKKHKVFRASAIAPGNMSPSERPFQATLVRREA